MKRIAYLLVFFVDNVSDDFVSEFFGVKRNSY